MTVFLAENKPYVNLFLPAENRNRHIISGAEPFFDLVQLCHGLDHLSLCGDNDVPHFNASRIGCRVFLNKSDVNSLRQIVVPCVFLAYILAAYAYAWSACNVTVLYQIVDNRSCGAYWYSKAQSLGVLEFIPTTCPKRLSSGPPLLPGLIAASVWIRVISYSSIVIVRSRALIIPQVIEP